MQVHLVNDGPVTFLLETWPRPFTGLLLASWAAALRCPLSLIRRVSLAIGGDHG